MGTSYFPKVLEMNVLQKNFSGESSEMDNVFLEEGMKTKSSASTEPKSMIGRI